MSLSGLRRLRPARYIRRPCRCRWYRERTAPSLAPLTASPVSSHSSGIDPAGDGAGARDPQRIVGVVAELRVMGAEAGIDEAVFLRSWDRTPSLAGRSVRAGMPWPMDDPSPCGSRPDFRCRAPPPPAKRGPSCRTCCCDCWRACAPDLFFTPIGRGADRIEHGRAMKRRAERFRRIGIGDRHFRERHLVRLRIEDRHVVGRVFVGAVQRAVGVDRRVAPVRWKSDRGRNASPSPIPTTR